MKEIDLKEYRKILKLTQAALAKKIGVSRKTVNNYEKTGVIPETKRELLLSLMPDNTLNEATAVYEIITGPEEKINQVKDEIQTREKIISSSTDENLIKHHQEMVKLLKIQIQEIEKAKKNIQLEQ